MLVMARPWVAHICSSLSPLSLVLSGETGPMTPLRALLEIGWTKISWHCSRRGMMAEKDHLLVADYMQREARCQDAMRDARMQC